MPRARCWLPLSLALPLLVADPKSAAAQSPASGRLVLLETQSIGIDPVVGRFVDRALRTSAQSAGFTLVPSDAARRGLAELGAPYPPSPAVLGRLTYRLHADRGVFAVAWASGGRYWVRVHVASRDGSGPFHMEADADSADLEARTAALLSQALQATATAVPSPAGQPTHVTPTTPVKRPTERPHFFAESTPTPSSAAPRWRIALHNDLAFGIAKQSFINEVVGGRFDLRVAPRSSIGAYLGYALLPGREGRVYSVLSYAQLEQRLPIVGESVQIPLRFGLGYLARNGGFLRLASGLAFGLGGGVELVLDLLTPSFWMTPDTNLFSLDLGTEIGVSF